MTYIWTPLAGLFVTVFGFIFCPFLVPFALPFIEWDSEPSQSGYPPESDPTYKTIRGDLPWFLSWFQTPDERLPCGVYEDGMRATLERWGKYVAAYEWMGLRNQLMGLACWLGHDALGYAPEDKDGFWTDGQGTWTFSFCIGPVRFLTGHKVYRLQTGKYRAAPTFTLKKA